jgi:hypothetical protein
MAQGRLIHTISSGNMKSCPGCGRDLPEINRFCTYCGRSQDTTPDAAPTAKTAGVQPDQLNLKVLYGMVAILLLALLFPPWETPPSQPPVFLGFGFILAPPHPDAIVSRMLLTIELTTTAIAGLYLSFLFRTKQ